MKTLTEREAGVKRDLHKISIETDDFGLATGVLIDGERVKGCTGVTASVENGGGFLNVTISMEADFIEGLVGMVAVNKPSEVRRPRGLRPSSLLGRLVKPRNNPKPLCLESP